MKEEKRYTAIWQSQSFYEREWLMRLFAPYISNHVYDGKHELVLDNSIVFDSFVYANDPDYYERFRGKNCFLVHVGDEFFELGTDRYLAFKGVFRTMWSGVFNPQHVFVLPLGFSTQMQAGTTKASKRLYAWSFVGEAGKNSRPDAVRALSSIEPHLCYSATSVPGKTFFQMSSEGKKRIPRADFVEILRQSAFAPAPMGNGSLESCRIYDALECGAIPIIERRITLDYFRRLLGAHPIPTVSSWSNARRLVEDLLREPQRLDELQQQCEEWWKSYQTALVENIGSFLEKRSQSTEQLVPLISRLPGLPFWKYFELLRHHSFFAFIRRMRQQAERVLKHRKWRVAKTAQSDTSARRIIP